MAGSKKSTDRPSEALPDAAWRGSLRRAVLGWYRIHARDLPWRRSRDPYRVWVSEIMLQQTQVATVRPYFERFVARFPSTRELAAAEEHEVLRLWEGLGYYRRARQLQEAARQIQQQHAGCFPRTMEQVRELPGIGRYTAGAILSIAFDQQQPILEGNTIRLYSRLLGFRGDPRRAAGQRRLWAFAAAILPRRDVGAFNQALMELGSEICYPRSPDCGRCPLQRLCPTHAHGWQEQIPAPNDKVHYEELRETAVLVQRRHRVLLRRCGPQERWAGLWDFPRFGHSEPLDDQPDFTGELTQRVAALTGVRVELGDRLTVLKHAVTRYRITLTCFHARYQSGRLRDQENTRWVTAEELASYPLSASGRKLAHWVR